MSRLWTRVTEGGRLPNRGWCSNGFMSVGHIQVRKRIQVNRQEEVSSWINTVSFISASRRSEFRESNRKESRKVD